MNTLKAGDKAPPFSLQDQNNHTVSLNDFVGSKVIVYFYPKAMTPGCTVQAQGLRDSHEQLSKAGAIVLGISPDSVSRLTKFAEKESLNFTLLSDPEHKTAEMFGVWGLKKFMGKEYDGIHRITFVIDEVGNISDVLDKFKTKDHHSAVMDIISK